MSVERVRLAEKHRAQVIFPAEHLPRPQSSSVQFKVIHVLLDPGITGVGAHLPALFGLEYHSWLGAETAGLVIIDHKVARKLPQGVREAAGSGRV